MAAGLLPARAHCCLVRERRPCERNKPPLSSARFFHAILPEIAFHGAVEHDRICSQPWRLRLLCVGLGNQIGQRQGPRSAAAPAARLGCDRGGRALSRRRDSRPRLHSSRPDRRAHWRGAGGSRQCRRARCGAGDRAAAGAANRIVTADDRRPLGAQGRDGGQRHRRERGGTARRRGRRDQRFCRSDRRARRNAPARRCSARPSADDPAQRDCRPRRARRSVAGTPARGDPRAACRTDRDIAGTIGALRSRPAASGSDPDREQSRRARGARSAGGACRAGEKPHRAGRRDRPAAGLPRPRAQPRSQHAVLEGERSRAHQYRSWSSRRRSSNSASRCRTWNRPWRARLANKKQSPAAA